MNFPVYRGLMNSAPTFKHLVPLSRRTATAVFSTMAAHPPVLWNIQNVSDFLHRLTQDRKGATYEEIGLNATPSRPPLDSIWLEYRNRVFNVGVYCELYEEQAWRLYIFTKQGADPVLVLPGMGVVSCGDDGVLVRSEVGVGDDLPDDDAKEMVDTIVAGAMGVVMVSFMFSHCKNVEIVERLPKRHEQRQAKREGQPVLRFHEIVIDPNRTEMREESQGSSPGGGKKRALHIARGHFAHYTAEKPLFGKHTGTYWVPAHVRGSDEQGVIDKRYKVKAAT